MRSYRCFHDAPVRAGERLTLAPEEATHLAKVRRLRDGEEAFVLDGRGTEARALAVDARRGVLEVGDIVRREESPGPALELGLALTRTGAFEDVLARAVELGITAFRPIETEHAVVRLDERKAAARHERWRRLAIERLKQCERLWLPEFHEPLPLAPLLEALSAAAVVPVGLVERAGPDVPPLGGLARSLGAAPACLLVGPEGGWTAAEAALLAAPPCRPATLGSAILRAETAALAAVAVAVSARLDVAGVIGLPNPRQTSSDESTSR